eukprot:gb/GECH01006261.1/.p1 GENE.gb/GECH01006261.1/~~gb/GECH01006261.1/.p1  ORF type:complete len:527 (+),score=149.98 gb/GECH01006261.1/:1-1581(+)
MINCRRPHLMRSTSTRTLPTKTTTITNTNRLVNLPKSSLFNHPKKTSYSSFSQKRGKTTSSAAIKRESEDSVNLEAKLADNEIHKNNTKDSESSSSSSSIGMTQEEANVSHVMQTQGLEVGGETVTIQDIEEARNRINNLTKVTPLSKSYSLSQACDMTVFLKYENLQMTGSYKERGAANKLLSLSPEEKERGVVASSAGNHAQALAFHAQRLGIDATICMPLNTPIAKVSGTERWGSRINLIGESFDDAFQEAQRIAQEENRVFVHAFNDSKIVAGAGTLGLEMIEQNPFLDAIVIPVGGGGLIAGLSVVIKSINPRIKVYGVEAANMPGMQQSVLKKQVTKIPYNKTIADGIAIRNVGPIPFNIISKYVDDIVTVSEDEIAEAVLKLLETEKTSVEGAGATPLAAVMSGKFPQLKNKRTALVQTGGNIDVSVMNDIISRGLVKSGRLVRLRVEVPDTPGELVQALQVIREHRANIQEVEHERAFMNVPVGYTQTILTVQTKGHDHVQQLVNALKEKNFKFTMDS